MPNDVTFVTYTDDLLCLGDNDNILSHSSPIKLNGSIKIQARLPLIFIKQ